MISPKICHCIHPFFRNYVPVPTPSSNCIRYSIIKDTVSSYFTKYTMCTGKNFTLPPAVTAWTNLTSVYFFYCHSFSTTETFEFDVFPRVKECDFSYVDETSGVQDSWDKCRLFSQEGYAYNIYICKVVLHHLHHVQLYKCLFIVIFPRTRVDTT